VENVLQVIMFLPDPNNQICLQSFQSTLSVGMNAKVPVDSSAINSVDWFNAKVQEYFPKEMKKRSRGLTEILGWCTSWAK
jgi:hypothetical protein